MSIKKILIWLPAIVMAMIIFGFSKQDGEESSGLSYKAADIILTVCDKAGIIDCNENNSTYDRICNFFNICNDCTYS